MKETIIFDSFAWVEYMLDSSGAKQIADILDVTNANLQEILTPTSVIAELQHAMLKNKISQSVIDRMLAFVIERSKLIDIDYELAKLAGETNHERKKKINGWGMMDSLVYAVAKSYSGKIVTGDQHFKGLPNVIWMGQNRT